MQALCKAGSAPRHEVGLAAKLTGHRGVVTTVGFDPWSGAVASGGLDGVVRVWPGSKLPARPSDRAFGSTATAANTVTAADGAIEVDGHGGAAIRALAFCPSQPGLLASAGDDSTVKLWSRHRAGTGSVLTAACLSGQHTGALTSLSFCSVAPVLVTGGNDHTARLWDLQQADGRCLGALIGHSGPVHSVAVDPAEPWLVATASGDRRVLLWDRRVPGKPPIGALNGHEGAVTAVAFDPNCPAVLVTGSTDTHGMLWDRRSGRCFSRLTGHRQSIRSVAFLPGVSNGLLVSGSDDGRVKLWGSRSGGCIATIAGHRAGVNEVACAQTAGSTVLATASDDRAVKLWTISQASADERTLAPSVPESTAVGVPPRPPHQPAPHRPSTSKPCRKPPHKPARHGAQYYELGTVQEKVANRHDAVEASRQALQHIPDLYKLSMDAAVTAMTRHAKKYSELHRTWQGAPWLTGIAEAHSAVIDTFPVPESPLDLDMLQPNPWANEGVDPTSKQYLVEVIKTLARPDGCPNGVVAPVARICSDIARDFGGAVNFILGPNKSEQRVFEKVLMVGGRFDKIRDYSRGCFVTRDPTIFPALVHAIAARAGPGFQPIWAKNRLCPKYDAAAESADYGDYQILVRSTGGWIVELQVILEPVFLLRKQLAHKDYKDFRFIVESTKRAKRARQAAIEAGKKGSFASLCSSDPRDSVEGCAVLG